MNPAFPTVDIKIALGVMKGCPLGHMALDVQGMVSSMYQYSIDRRHPSARRLRPLRIRLSEDFTKTETSLVLFDNPVDAGYLGLASNGGCH